MLKKTKINALILLAFSGAINIANAQSQDSTYSQGSSIRSVSPGGQSGQGSSAVIRGPEPAGCPLPWGGNVTSGNSVMAYPSSSSYSCGSDSQVRNCTNGSLSGSFTNGACSATPPPPPPPPTYTPPPPTYTPPPPPPPPAQAWYEKPINARSYNFKTSNAYDRGQFTVSTSGTFQGTYQENRCNFQGGSYPMSGNMCLYSDGIWYPTSTTGVTPYTTDYNILGSVNRDGVLNGQWNSVTSNNTYRGTGVMTGAPSGSGSLAGQFTNAGGNVDNWNTIP